MASKAEAKKNYDDKETKEASSENAAEVAHAIATLKYDDEDSTRTTTEEDKDEDETKQEDESTEDSKITPEVESGTFTGAGSYKFDTAEHVDEYLKNLGVGLVFRKVQSAANPTMTIFPCTGNEWAIKMDSIFRTREVKFQLEKEFTDETFDGRVCRSTATLEGSNRLVMIQHCTTGGDVKVVYELKPDSTMHISLTCGPHAANLFFSSNSDL